MRISPTLRLERHGIVYSRPIALPSPAQIPVNIDYQRSVSTTVSKHISGRTWTRISMHDFVSQPLCKAIIAVRSDVKWNLIRDNQLTRASNYSLRENEYQRGRHCHKSEGRSFRLVDHVRQNLCSRPIFSS